jgi:hypothetical protein
MHGMAFAAVAIDCRMDMGCISIALIGIFMTTATHQTLLTLQQARAVAGMGTVAICAAVANVSAEMIMNTVCRLTLLRMAIQADFGGNRSLAIFMAIITTSCIGIMQPVTNHVPSIAAMRVVARQTPLNLQGIIFVHPIHCIIGVTCKTDLL